MPHVCIIGGGIAGLSTAWYLQRQAHAAGQTLDITVFEADQRMGGKIATFDQDGFVIEGGPDSFLTQKGWGQRLCHELGLDAALRPMNSRPVYVMHGGRLHKFPMGFRLAIPTKWWPVVTTSLFSIRGKLRMAMEPFIKARPANAGDESLANFLRRRLGQEAVDVIGEPLMAGIHSADPETLSIAATFPQFVAMEQKYGSLVKGMRAEAAARPRPAPGATKPNGIPASPFLTLEHGMVQLVDALCEQLHADLRPNTPVREVRRAPSGHGFELRLSDDSVHADAVVLALPAYLAAEVVQHMHPNLAGLLDEIPYASTATVSLAYPEADFAAGCDFDGIGFVIGAGESTRLQAVTISSRKFDGRCPEGQVLIRAFVGGHRHEEMVHLTDRELLEVVCDELETVLGIEATPTLSKIYRWPRANPQYLVGHLDRVQQMESLASQYPGLYLTGSAYSGVGIPACVGAAHDTAKAVAAALGWPDKPLPAYDPPPVPPTPDIEPDLGAETATAGATTAAAIAAAKVAGASAVAPGDAASAVAEEAAAPATPDVPDTRKSTANPPSTASSDAHAPKPPMSTASPGSSDGD